MYFRPFLMILALATVICLLAPSVSHTVGSDATLDIDGATPTIIPIYPEPGSVMTAPPSMVSFTLAMPQNASVEDLSCKLDGLEYELTPLEGGVFRMEIPDSHWNWSGDAQTDFEEMYGPNEVTVVLGANLEAVGYQQFSLNWTFSLLVGPPLMNMGPVQYLERYGLSAPSAWTVFENQTVGTTMFDLMIQGPSMSPGPAMDEVVTKITVQSGIDPSANGDPSYFQSVIDAIVVGLHGQGYDVSVSDGPTYEMVNGLPASLFDLAWPTTNGVMQRIGLIVDEDQGAFWIITCSVASPFFPAYAPYFQESITSLEVAEAGSDLEPFQYHEQYRLDLPSGWPVSLDQNVGGEEVDLIASGPQHEGFATNINVISREGVVHGDKDWLWDQVNDTIETLEGQGYSAELVGQPEFVEIGGLPAVLFTLRWTSGLGIEQRIGMVVNEELGKAYVITCSVHQSRFVLYAESFDAVIVSLEVLEAPSEDDADDEPTLLYLAAGVGIIAALVVGVLLFIRTRKR